ncbi:replication initiator protein A [Anaerosalibacter massiliensis]|nr:replication initiator protein A [Anaerosalibacter massiliensis]
MLYTEQILKNLSSDAKVLYGILLDRMELSIGSGEWMKTL